MDGSEIASIAGCLLASQQASETERLSLWIHVRQLRMKK